MQSFMVLCLLATLSTGSARNVSPVTRVVNLLKDLQKTAEKDGKNEQDLFESFVCWGKSVIAQKTASNVAAASRISALTTILADTAAGLETERQSGLQTEIDALTTDLAEAQTLRAKENTDFESAKTEMQAAIKALESAKSVLGEATKDSKTGVLMAVRSNLNQGLEAVLEQQQDLKHAVSLGERYLDKADSTFLRRMLSGDVPKVDWKKLNRKASFKMAYKGRSFKIQKTLTSMETTFRSNLKDAEDNEDTSKTSYDTLSGTKGQQLTAAQGLLTNGAVQAGKLEVALAEDKLEKQTLEGNIEADAEFITQTESDLTTKKAEHVTRNGLRTSEIAAMSKAVSILASDDARDLMKKSFSSQEGLFLLQTSASTQQVSAASAIRLAAKKSGDSRLLALAELATQAKGIKGNNIDDEEVTSCDGKVGIDAVCCAIGKMVLTLKSEEDSDLATKQSCEKTRMEDTRTALEKSHGMDDDTDAMAQLHQRMDELTQDIADLNVEKKSSQDELVSAGEQREKERAEWTASDADDTSAAATVKQARDVLANFYAENNLVLVQDKVSAPKVVAGVAPPPPAATWDGDYGGKTSESAGIIAMLDMVREDILKDQTKASADENAAAASYEAFKTKTNAEINAFDTTIGLKEGLNGTRATDFTNTKAERKSKGDTLAAVMTKMDNLNGNCEFFTENYLMRRTNRALELDGLRKAKIILLNPEAATAAVAADAAAAAADAADPFKAAAAGFLQKKTSA